jgi:hypothetical protein
MNTKELAAAFAKGEEGRGHNATVQHRRHEGLLYVEYRLHGHCIAHYIKGNREFALGYWCGYYTRTTANHLNTIRDALKVDGRRVSYAKARDASSNTFSLMEQNPYA